MIEPKKQNYLNKIFKSGWTWTLLVVFILILLFVFWPEADAEFDSEKVERTNVSEVVTGTATVTAENETDLSFQLNGEVSEILVQEGQAVRQGQVLARLDDSTTANELASARANLDAQEAQLAELQAGVTKEEEQAALANLRSAELSLENARDALLSADPQAYFVGDQKEESIYTYESPVVSGSYQGNEKGQYNITLYRSMTQSGYSFRYSGIESGVGEVSTQKPQPLGSKGLYIQFPRGFARDSGVEWMVEIPNTRSSTYVSNKQAYEQAKSAYQKAEADYNLSISPTRSERIASQEANLRQAQANLDMAQDNLDKTVLRAPFSGIVRSAPISLGQNISANTTAFSMISENNNHLTFYAPEADVANLQVGDKAELSFSAFGGEVFDAEVGYISPSAESRDGLNVFKTRLYFTENDSRIRVGMSADLDIFSVSVEDALSVPGRAIIRRDNKNFLRIIEDGMVEEREVEVGLRGHDGRTEIVSGISESDEVITFIQEDQLQKLERK